MSGRGQINCVSKGIRSMINHLKNRGKFWDPIKPSSWTIIKGDKVEVTQGDETGKQGTVLRVIRAQNRVIVEGIQMRRRIVKAKGNTPATMVTRPTALPVSYVHLLDPQTNLPCKVKRNRAADGTRIRVSRATGLTIPKPFWKRDNPRRSASGPKDSAPDDVYEVTNPDYMPLPIRPRFQTAQAKA